VEDQWGRSRCVDLCADAACWVWLCLQSLQSKPLAVLRCQLRLWMCICTQALWVVVGCMAYVLDGASCACECVYAHRNQGYVIRRICIIRRIVFNAYFTVLNKLGRSIRLQNLPFLPFWGLFRQFPPQQRPFSELSMLLRYILLTRI